MPSITQTNKSGSHINNYLNMKTIHISTRYPTTNSKCCIFTFNDLSAIHKEIKNPSLHRNYFFTNKYKTVFFLCVCVYKLEVLPKANVNLGHPFHHSNLDSHLNLRKNPSKPSPVPLLELISNSILLKSKKACFPCSNIHPTQI